MMDFSIIIPTYNAGNFLSETLESISKIPANILFEVIIVDDGSTDGSTAGIREKYPQYILIQQSNAGEAFAVNAGLNRASGKFGLVVNADDPIIGPEIFSNAKKLFTEFPEVVGTYGDFYIIDEQGKILKTIKKCEFSMKEFLGNNNCLPGPGSFFRLSIAQAINGRNSSYKYVGDYDFWLRMSELGQLKYTNCITGIWRDHKLSTSISSRSLEMSMERIKVIQDYVSRNKIDRPLTRRALAVAHYRAARLALFDTRIDGRKLVLKALRLNYLRVPTANPLLILFLILPLNKRLFIKISNLILRMAI